MSRKILIFDSGKCLGTVDIGQPKEGVLIEMLKVRPVGADKDVDVLHVIDMNYGIIVEADVAKGINDALNE